MNLARQVLASLLPCMLAVAQGPRSADAVALVKRAVAFAKVHGIEKLIQETNQAGGKFHVTTGGELYIYIFDEHCILKANGFKLDLVGKDRSNIKDPDGVFYAREIVHSAMNMGRGWVDYKFANPATGAIEQKTSYNEYYERLIICSGIYSVNP